MVRVKEQDEGDYEAIKYALRERKSLKRIMKQEWKSLGTDIVDEATILLMINAARASFGRQRLRQLPASPSRNKRARVP